MSNTVILSKEAMLKAKGLIENTFLELERNNKELQDAIDRQFLTIRDMPSYKKYIEMMTEIQSMMSQLRSNFNDIDEFCDKMIRFYDTYTLR